jgi:glucose-1-phosphate cytidylyltransferase
MNQVKAVILCGGLGTRIREANENLPKPMLPIGGKPILWHIMKGYSTHGIADFVLCLGYRGWLIREFFLNYAAMTTDITVSLGRRAQYTTHGRHGEEDWNVTLSDTGESTMTGGRVAAIRRYVADDDIFLLTYGDGVSNVDITRTIAFHKKHGKIVTVTAVRPPGRFGELAMRGDEVFEFNEKPQATAGFINGGFFVIDAKRVWDYLTGGPGEVLENEPLKRLAAEGQLVAFPHTGFWQPVDTLREYSLLNDMWASGNAPWNSWSRPQR